MYEADLYLRTFKPYIRGSFPRAWALMFSAVPRTLKWKPFVGEVYLFRCTSPMLLYALGRLISKNHTELPHQHLGVKVEVAFIRTTDLLGMASIVAAQIPAPGKSFRACPCPY